MPNNGISLEIDGKELTITNWSKITKVNRKTIYCRHVAGWTPRQCVGFDPPPYRCWRRGKLGPKPRKNNLTEFSPIQLATVNVVAVDNVATGQAVKEIRKRAGLSMEQAADLLGWGHGRMWKLEKGEIQWKQKHIDHFNTVAKGWVQNGNDDRTTAVNDRTSGTGTVDVQWDDLSGSAIR